MKRVILILTDGLWIGELAKESCEALSPLMNESTRYLNHKGASPSVTRISSATIATGCSPSVHGLFGNRVIMENPKEKKLEVKDVGHPSFFPYAQEVWGSVLQVPTLSQLIKDVGIFVACSNVSPGAAYLLDPEHAGYVFHRAGSFAPGGIQLQGEEGLPIEKGLYGDRIMTERFICEYQKHNSPLGVLWLGEPDTSLHLSMPGAPVALSGIRNACDCILRVHTLVQTLREQGDDVLLMFGSDHGMESVNYSVAIRPLLFENGLISSLEDSSIAIASNGGSALVAVEGEDSTRIEQLISFFNTQNWVQGIYADEGDVRGSLSSIGLKKGKCLSFAINANYTGEISATSGLPLRYILSESGTSGPITETGSHGFFDGCSCSPYLFANGDIFKETRQVHSATSLTNIAPTILSHLGISIPAWMKDLPLQFLEVTGGSK